LIEQGFSRLLGGTAVDEGVRLRMGLEGKWLRALDEGE
jgi:hypothetical protein